MTDSKYPIEPMGFDDIQTYPLGDRKSKVNVDVFGRPPAVGDSVSSFLEKLPRILAGNDLRELVDRLDRSRNTGKSILWGMGGHVVKCGLGPIFIDMIRDGLVSGIAMNGAAAIHDFEIALRGSTSEEVEIELGSGRFGMAQETGEYLNAAVNTASSDGLGMGEGIGRFIADDPANAGFAHSDSSILAAAYARSIPVTVHVAIGTDITHMHPTVSGAKLGQTSMHDFRLLCALVGGLEGGVYLNLGSAVILPEVFLKAVSVARNLGRKLDNFTTANLDFIQHYRPRVNVLERPTANGGRAIALTGHHEIMLPLIASALKERAGGQRP